MKRKILFSVMSAIIIGSLFVSLKLVTAVDAESMWLDPEFKTVDPTSSNLTFLYDLYINTTIDVSGWEAKLLWDSSVLRALSVVWGNFMDDPTYDVVWIPGTGESITLGQTFQTQHTVNGTGILAQINFTFVLPGATEVRLLEATILDSTLTKHDLLTSSVSGKVKSNCPHPEFTWTTDDGINPLPNHTISNDGDMLINYDVVHFNASTSYDVCNLYWNGSAFMPDVNYPDIVSYFWDFGDGTNTTTAGPTTSHVYQDYNPAGWLVNLTVTDSEAQSWSTTWRYPGPLPSDTVPMWRDVAVADFWPSLPPWELWNNGSGSDWYAWWWFDTVDYTIPRVDSYYWNYNTSDYWRAWEDPNQLYAKDVGILILMTFANLGSVPELCKMTLYAIYLQEDLDFAPGPVYTFNKETELIVIRQSTYTIQPGSGTGWGWYFTPFMPEKNGYYLLFATIEFKGALTDDQNPDNNYLAAPNILDTIYSFGVQTPENTFAKYMCDINGDGTVDLADFEIFGINYGSSPPPK